jgi:hypothetical protein
MNYIRVHASIQPCAERMCAVPMIKFKGHPRSSALFYWKDQSTRNSQDAYLASYFTISPIKLEENELLKIDKSNFLYPIMIHEPLPVRNIDTLVAEAKERNATIVNCGEATANNVKTKMRLVLAEYLDAYIQFLINMEEKIEKIPANPIKDLHFKKLKQELTKTSISERIVEITQLTGELRSLLDLGQSGARINRIILELQRMRLEESYDFEGFLKVVALPGKIAAKMTELYIKQFYNILSDNTCNSEECREDICSLDVLRKLDDLKERIRKHVAGKEMSKVLNDIEEIYRIKNTNPRFCSGEDLDKFCKALTFDGMHADTLCSLYIEKYFLVINKRFQEAGELYKQICKMSEEASRS